MKASFLRQESTEHNFKTYISNSGTSFYNFRYTSFVNAENVRYRVHDTGRYGDDHAAIIISKFKDLGYTYKIIKYIYGHRTIKKSHVSSVA